MGLGTSLFLIAVGAVLDFAIDVQTQGFNLHTIGVILMVVGVIGAVLSLVFWSSWGGFHSSRQTVVESGPGRRVYQDEVV
jgi:sulfite exporter TauE/SafE